MRVRLRSEVGYDQSKGTIRVRVRSDDQGWGKTGGDRYPYQESAGAVRLLLLLLLLLRLLLC